MYMELSSSAHMDAHREEVWETPMQCCPAASNVHSFYYLSLRWRNIPSLISCPLSPHPFNSSMCALEINPEMPCSCAGLSHAAHAHPAIPQEEGLSCRSDSCQVCQCHQGYMFNDNLPSEDKQGGLHLSLRRPRIRDRLQSPVASHRTALLELGCPVQHLCIFQCPGSLQASGQSGQDFGLNLLFSIKHFKCYCNGASLQLFNSF